MKKVLILRFSSLGDVVLTSYVVENLYNAGWEVWFATKPEYAPLFQSDPRIAGTIVFQSIFSAIREIRYHKFDLIFDLHSVARTMFISALSGTKVLHANKRSLQRRLLTHFGGDKTPRKLSDEYARLIRLAGLPITYNFTRIIPNNNGIAFAEKHLAHIDKKIAFIHAGARYAGKDWGIENYRECARLVFENEFHPIFVGEGESGNFHSFLGKTSLEELVGALSFGAVFIGNDSGPSHIAAALEVPTVTIFGPTHPALGFSPAGKFSTYVSAETACAPCSLHGDAKCKFAEQLCFTRISPQMVFEKVMAIYYQSIN